MKNYLLSIGEFSKLTGIHIKSLRYYDELGILKPQHVNPSSKYRYYSYTQIALAMSVQMCVEFEIPLKTFPQYLDGDNLLYEKILEEGKVFAQKKIHAMQKSLEQIERGLEDVRISQNHTPGEIYRRTIAPMAVLVCEAPERNDRMYENATALYDRAVREGLEPGYAYGSCAEHRDAHVVLYDFLEIVGDLPDGSGIRHFPAGEYLCVQESGDGSEEAEERLLRELAADSDYLIVRSEIGTPRYNLQSPLMEFRAIKQ